MEQRKITKKNIYIFLSVFFPVLSIYASPIPGVDFGTLCVLVFALVMFMSNPSIKMPRPLTFLLLYSALSIIPVLFGLLPEYSSTNSILVRLLRFIVVLVVMIGFGYTTYYDENSYVKTLRFLSIIVSTYAILQTVVFNFTGIKLRNIFGLERGGAMFTSTLGEYESIYRPPSIFLEPSGVTYFLTPFLCYILFHQKKTSRKDLFIAALVSVGIVVSTSGQGLMVLALCWGIWFFSQIRKMNISSILLAFILGAILFNNFDFSFSTSRITRTDELNAIDARAGGYELFRQMSGFDMIFGNGFGNYVEEVYYSSFAEILFCTGCLGLLIVLVFYLFLFVKGVRYQKILVLASILLMFGGGIYTATYLCLYLPLLLQPGSNIILRYRDA